MSFSRAWKFIWRTTLVFSVFNVVYYALVYFFSWPAGVNKKSEVVIKITQSISQTIVLPWSNLFNLILNPIGLLVFGLGVFGIYKLFCLVMNKYFKDSIVLILILMAVLTMLTAGLGFGITCGLNSGAGLGISLFIALVFTLINGLMAALIAVLILAPFIKLI